MSVWLFKTNRSTRGSLLLVFILHLTGAPAVSISETVIDPQAQDTNSQSFQTVVHCLADGHVIKIGDPFDPSYIDDPLLIIMEWKIKTVDGGEKSLAYFTPSGKKVLEEFQGKVSIFQTWGIEISPVTNSDTAVYKASLTIQKLNGAGPEFPEKQLNITVASAPRLASARLSVSTKGKGDKQMLSCGKVASLGEPPISLVWRDENGTVLESTFEDGHLNLQLNQTADSDRLECEIDEASVAKECIPLVDRDLWDTTYNVARSTASADMTGIIAGAVAATIFILIIIVIIACIISRKRKTAYNTKKGEKRKKEEIESKDGHGDQGRQVEEQRPLNRRRDGDEEEEEELPPRLASKAASPYCVSNINPVNDTNHYASSPVNKVAPRQPASPHQQQQQSVPKPLPRQQKTAPLVPTEETAGVGNGRHNRQGEATAANVPPPVMPKSKAKTPVPNPRRSVDDFAKLETEVRGDAKGSETCV